MQQGKERTHTSSQGRDLSSGAGEVSQGEGGRSAGGMVTRRMSKFRPSFYIWTRGGLGWFVLPEVTRQPGRRRQGSPHPPRSGRSHRFSKGAVITASPVLPPVLGGGRRGIKREQTQSGLRAGCGLQRQTGPPRSLLPEALTHLAPPWPGLPGRCPWRCLSLRHPCTRWPACPSLNREEMVNSPASREHQENHQ